MKKAMVPLNLMVLDTNDPRVKALRPVTTMDVFEGATRQFHPEGLFSTQIFGRIGDPMRDKIFGRIDLKVPVFDPTCFELLTSLKSLYKEIIFGRKYALFDDDNEDFVISDAINGDTGYDFFMKHWQKINFLKNDSDRRNTKITALEKYKHCAEMKILVVLPAGLRDIEVAEGGRPEENEVNDLYRKAMSAARVIIDTTDTDRRSMNGARSSLQRAIQEIWTHFFTVISGKKGYIQARYAGRRIFYGTRNVITAMETTPARLGDPNNIKATDTQVGIFQTAKGQLPVTIGCMRRYLLRHVFSESPEVIAANLIDAKSLKQVKVEVPYGVKDYWVTRDGLTKVIDSYKDDALRFKPIMIKDHYLGLIYEGSDMTFRMFHDIDQLPEGWDRSRVRPINLTDLMYLTCYKEWVQRYILPTRYPATGMGSIYPATVRLTSTVPEEARKELNDEWQLDESSMHVGSYPIRGQGAFFDSMAMHPSRLEAADADHDGDMASGNYLISDESIAELGKLMRSATSYLDPRGGLRASPSVYTVDLVAHNLTGD